MTEDDLKIMQDRFMEGAKTLLLTQGRLQMAGFVITLHKHVDKLFESGWGLEFIDPKDCLRDASEDGVATLVIDLTMDWKRLYHAVLNVFPQTCDVLPQMLALGRAVDVDDPTRAESEFPDAVLVRREGRRSARGHQALLVQQALLVPGRVVLGARRRCRCCHTRERGPVKIHTFKVGDVIATWFDYRSVQRADPVRRRDRSWAQGVPRALGVGKHTEIARIEQNLGASITNRSV